MDFTDSVLYRVTYTKQKVYTTVILKQNIVTPRHLGLQVSMKSSNRIRTHTRYHYEFF